MLVVTRLALVAILSVWTLSAWAQQPPLRLRGTIEALDGNVLSVKTNDGAAHKITLTDNVTVVAVVKATQADIKEGSYLGSAAMPQSDGSQKALEVHIFPDSMRGTGEGHRPYAPVQGGTMTNGTVNATGAAADGHGMTVRHRDGETKIVVPAGIPIVRYVIGDKSDLKAGAAFTVLSATKKPDGTLEAARVNVGRDGAVPQ